MTIPELSPMANLTSDLELARCLAAADELVRASHFVQLFNYQGQ